MKAPAQAGAFFVWTQLHLETRTQNSNRQPCSGQYRSNYVARSQNRNGVRVGVPFDFNLIDIRRIDPATAGLQHMHNPADNPPVTWESEQPVPPGVIWRSTIERMRQTSAKALQYPLDAFTGQNSWTEIPFGTGTAAGERTLPWRPEQDVPIPGTGIRIQGHIDRLDMSSDRKRARVIDYKTGKLNKKMAEVVIKGGSELQRCLYRALRIGRGGSQRTSRRLPAVLWRRAALCLRTHRRFRVHRAREEF